MIVRVIVGFGLDTLLVNIDLFDRVIYKVYSLSYEGTKTSLNLSGFSPAHHYPLEGCRKLEVLFAFDDCDVSFFPHLSRESSGYCGSCESATEDQDFRFSAGHD